MSRRPPEERGIVELVARDVAAAHYAKRLGLRLDDEHVRRLVDRNWKQTGLPSVRLVLGSLEGHGYAVPDQWERQAQEAQRNGR
jgi:hypothetical protein